MPPKKILDCTDWQTEFDKLLKKEALLESRFLAVAMDYEHYIDNSWGQKEIYTLRDDTLYRLFCSRFHIELLLRQHLAIEDKLNQKFQKEPEFFRRRYLGPNPLYEHYSKEVSGIFDSTIYHMASSFDYLSTLCNFICGENKQAYIKWTQLTKSLRDHKNSISKSKITPIVLKVHNEFVNKLYRHRSTVIHEKSDYNIYAITMTLGPDNTKFKPKFYIGKYLTKSFNELRELNKTHNITVIYSAFWLLNKSFDEITHILFSLKNQMESNPKVPHGKFGFYDEATKTIKSVSIAYWKESEYKNN